MKFLWKLFKPKVKHVWKEVRRENLSPHPTLSMNYPHEPCEAMYRIAIHEECLVTGEVRIREIKDIFPVYD